jgi:hypothetical protein
MRNLAGLLIVIILLPLCAGCSTKKGSKDPSSVETLGISKNLTAAQKEKDFQFLTDLIVKTYPFIEGNAKYKGLTELDTLSKDYIERAKRTKDDTEFMKLFEEYLTLLSQTGHAYLVKTVHLDYLNTISQDFKTYYNSYSDLNKVSKDQVAYWSKIDDALPKSGFIQPEVHIAYDKGKYVTRKDSILKPSGIYIPMDSILEEIEEKNADAYIKSLQSKVHLNFDYKLKKLYLPNPLIILPDNSSKGWKVKFKLPDGRSITEVVHIGIGDKSTANSLDAEYPNVVTVELNENTGYIKVFGMGIGTGNVLQDKESIEKFIRQSQGKYQKLIVDIRGNNGGDPAYWMDYLVAPLIKKPVKYTQTAAVKNDFIQRWDSELQNYLGGKQGLLSDRLHFSMVKEVLASSDFDKSWRVFDVTREIQPKDSLPFSGEVFLLTDEKSFSASEDFALFCKQTGFAKIVGTKTGGGAAVFLLSHIFALPESKILFCVEMEAALNPDGTINEIMGTTPDIEMGNHESPGSYKVKALLDDKWIQRIMSQP